MLPFFQKLELLLNSKHSPEHSPDAEYLVFRYKTYHFADVVCGWFVLAGGHSPPDGQLYAILHQELRATGRVHVRVNVRAAS